MVRLRLPAASGAPKLEVFVASTEMSVPKIWKTSAPASANGAPKAIRRSSGAYLETKVGPAHLGHRTHGTGIACDRDLAAIEDIGEVRDRERHLHVLLDEQHREP